MMAIAAANARVATKDAPDGPAFYPFGSWGVAYLLDERATRRLETWCRWQPWVQVPLTMLFIPDFMPGRRDVRYAVGMIVTTSLISAAFRFCVRDCRRTAVRLTAEENLRMTAAAMTFGQVSLIAILLVPLLTGFGLAFIASPPQRAPVAGGIDLAFTAWLVVRLVRVGALRRRLDRLPSTQPGLWMRRR